MEQVQLSLFDFPKDNVPSKTKETAACKLKWSQSRRSLFMQCPKKYYYNHYGANKRTAVTEPLKEQLAILKKLTNRYLTAGIVLHNLIKKTIKELQQGKNVSLDDLLDKAQNRYRKQLGYSQGWRKNSIEAYYNVESANELITETEKKLLLAIANLIQSSNFHLFRLFFSQPQSFVEKSISIKENNTFLGGKLDFAYINQDRLAIVDWKLGSSVGSTDPLQLMSYAYLASEELGYAPENIDLYQAHLASDRISSFEISKNDIFRTKSLIIQDLEIMNRFHDYGQKGISEAFTPCGQQRVCQLCPFQEVCLQE